MSTPQSMGLPVPVRDEALEVLVQESVSDGDEPGLESPSRSPSPAIGPPESPEEQIGEDAVLEEMQGLAEDDIEHAHGFRGSVGEQPSEHGRRDLVGEAAGQGLVPDGKEDRHPDDRRKPVLEEPSRPAHDGPPVPRNGRQQILVPVHDRLPGEIVDDVAPGVRGHLPARPGIPLELEDHLPDGRDIVGRYDLPAAIPADQGGDFGIRRRQPEDRPSRGQEVIELRRDGHLRLFLVQGDEEDVARGQELGQIGVRLERQEPDVVDPHRGGPLLQFGLLHPFADDHEDDILRLPQSRGRLEDAFQGPVAADADRPRIHHDELVLKAVSSWKRDCPWDKASGNRYPPSSGSRSACRAGTPLSNRFLRKPSPMTTIWSEIR